MVGESRFLSCDWGTTNFRLRLIDRNDLRILKEHKSQDGIKQLNDRAKKEQKDPALVIKGFLIDLISEKFDEDSDTPLICTGMISSTLGIKELPYADLPINVSGVGLVSEVIDLNGKKEILIVSGARNELGFMRGEETQAIGLSDRLSSKGVLILPGTHSKHLYYESGQFNEMKNFMTGELFNVLSSHSILASSSDAISWSDEFEDVFIEGVKVGAETGLAENLLTVRARHLFQNQSSNKGFFYLSGLIIGDEISYLRDYKDHVYLAASDSTFPLYKNALQSIISSDQLSLFDNTELRKGLFAGQRKMLDLNGW